MRDSNEIYELISGGLENLKYNIKEQKWILASKDQGVIARLIQEYKESLK